MIYNTIIFALVILSLLIYIIFRWIKGIDYMKENHPDYKGDDWLNWDNDDKPKPSITPKNAKEMMITKLDDFYGKIDFDSENENDKNQIQ